MCYYICFCFFCTFPGLIVREWFGAQLDAEECLAESLVTYKLLVIADERADENGSAARCEDASVHIVAALLIVEVTAHMHRHKGRIQQPHLTDGRETPLPKAHVTLDGKEVTMLPAEHEATRVVADIVYHILQLAFVHQQAVVIAFLPKGAQGGVLSGFALFARIRATPNLGGRSIQLSGRGCQCLAVGCPAYLRGRQRCNPVKSLGAANHKPSYDISERNIHLLPDEENAMKVIRHQLPVYQGDISHTGLPCLHALLLRQLALEHRNLLPAAQHHAS